MCALQIIIFDPSEIMREGIKQIVSRTNRGFQFLDIFCEPDLLNVLTKKSSPVIFLTLNSAKLNGHRVAISLLKQFKNVRLILLTNDLGSPLLTQLIQLGARSVLSIYSTSKDIEDAFRSVIIGDRYLFGTENIAQRKSIAISTQEYQIVDLLAKGKTSKEISIELNKTAKTIETYRSRLLKKTGSRNTSELLYFCIKNNICGVP